jgi:hypothetical protein
MQHNTLLQKYMGCTKHISRLLPTHRLRTPGVEDFFNGKRKETHYLRDVIGNSGCHAGIVFWVSMMSMICIGRK